MAELNQFTIVFDLDQTLCEKKKSNESYSQVKPIDEMIAAVNTLHDNSVQILIDSARNMVTQSNDESKVLRNVGLDTLNWLNDNNIQYDGIKFGKSYGHCYVDDKALRPKEFLKIYNSLSDKDDINELREKIRKYLEEN